MHLYLLVVVVVVVVAGGSSQAYVPARALQGRPLSAWLQVSDDVRQLRPAVPAPVPWSGEDERQEGTHGLLAA